MNIKNKKMILLVVIAAVLIPHISQADANAWFSKESWREWLHKLTEPEPLAQEEKPETKSKSEKDVNDFPKQQLVEDGEKIPTVDFYDSLGIKYFPKQYLVGNQATLQKYINTLFDGGQNRQAIAFFISLEREKHAMAISLLESMAHPNRLTILMEAPSAFIAKILVDMRNVDFKAKVLPHWGPFELESDYFGRKVFDTAVIKGESVSLRYISFLLGHNTESKNEFGERVRRLVNILSHVSGVDLVPLLVYSKEETLVKMGDKHESCFGAVKTKGHCDKETPIHLSENFVGQLLNVMHQGGMISKQDLVSILEKEFKMNLNRFNLILEGISIEVIKDVALNFPEEIIECLPEEVILSVMPEISDDAQNFKDTLTIGYGQAHKNMTNNTVASVIESTEEQEDDNNDQGMKEDLK